MYLQLELYVTRWFRHCEVRRIPLCQNFERSSQFPFVKATVSVDLNSRLDSRRSID